MLVNYRIKDPRNFNVRVPDKFKGIFGCDFVTPENITDEIAATLIMIGRGSKIELSSEGKKDAIIDPKVIKQPHSITPIIGLGLAEDLDFWQIIFDETQKPKLEPGASIYFQKGLTPFFEDEVIARHVFNDKPFTGIFSYSWMSKFKNPHKITIEQHLKVLRSDETIGAVGHHKHHGHGRNMWPSAERWHKGIIEMAETVLSEMGYQINLRELSTSEPFYFNNFIARTEIYKDYVDAFLQPAMKIMVDNDDLSQRLMQDSGYGKKSLYKGKLMATIGVPHYPYHPFLLERWFSTYCALKGIKQVNL